MKYLGIDYGTKKVGVAISDESGAMAFPKTILKNRPALEDELVSIARAERVLAFVVGESLDSEGRDNKVMKDAHAFAARLKEASGLPVFFERESFSSVEARRMPAKPDLSRRPREQRVHVDDSAAALILQRYLDKQKKHD